jgi:hypothetical protein
MLKGSDTVAGDGFGIRVAISGTTAIVGANGHASDAGRAYVFTGTAFGWKQTAELKGSDTVAGDYLGSVAISGTTAVVGAEGHASDAGRAYVFTETAFGWTQVAELDGSDTVAGNAFGNSVAISGTTAIVGAFGAAGSAGRAYVFTGTPTGWKQTAELKGSAGAGGFGGSVAISGTTVIVGAFGPNKEPGRAYVFTKTGAAWKQVAELEGSDSVAGDSFGISVAISGTTAVVGAFDHANLAGRAYVFTKTGASWKQVAELVGSDTVAFDDFGTSVAISGTTAVVGATAFEPVKANVIGRAYLFSKTGMGWKQTAELKGSHTDLFGDSVAISGMTVMVGAPEANNSGRAYVFEA